MTRVRFLRGTALGGIGNDAYPGELRELPEWQAAQLIAGGRAVLALAAPIPDPEPAAAPAEADPRPTLHPRKKGK